MESVSQGDEQEGSSGFEKYTNAGSLYSQQYASNSRPTTLEQYAANFKGGLLEAHTDAFDPYDQQRQPLRRSNHGHYHSPYPAYGPSIAPHHRLAQPHHSQHHNRHPHSTAINPFAPTSHHRRSTPTSTATVNHRIGLPSPPSSTGHPPPEQPRHAKLPHSSSSSSSFFCCGKTYGSKFTFNRHRRESRTCPHGSGSRRFVCYICANTDQPFGRRASLKQHVQEVHRRSPEEANLEVDTWYGRYGEGNDHPEVVKDSPEAVEDSPEVMKDLDRP
ncbi:hypothetical protein DIS24_g11331 [Lasiodiplodia hormozganensis]|uniref:Uncharacterized protein n=1 Tax=Lasiodiplodia hormozganensis TaxID=869390 RepID=A0AA39WV71_9PEZI|nr:hypothetical protein DIS24_g11331 [Lasiodiplodia hormozganensis]